MLHHCDVPICVNPQHLFLGTQADNARDRDAKGRHRPLRGIANGEAKLTDDDVRTIRERYPAWTQKQLAAAFNVHQSLISLIVRRKNWCHVA